VVPDLGYPDNAELRRWQPGSHIDLILGNIWSANARCAETRMMRRPGVSGCCVHDNLRQGAVVRVRGPRNHFQLVEAALGALGHVDILVNNAGGGVIRPTLAHTDETLQATIDNNLWTTIRCSGHPAAHGFSPTRPDH
jgi:NAD(P)-dependent dehydrogenase (short-subunit alcohol dehydrogenase family)